jgi:hypothetical protein
MECSICFEKFIFPNSNEESFETLYSNYKKDEIIDEYKKLINFKHLIITTKHDSTIKCETPNCNSTLCNNCFTKLTFNGKELEDAYEEDFPSENTLFKCPFCRQVYYKYYMKVNILNELLEKVLGVEKYRKYMIKKLKDTL